MSESEVIFRSTLKRLDQSQARLDELTPSPTNVVLGATLQPEDLTGPRVDPSSRSGIVRSRNEIQRGGV